MEDLFDKLKDLEGPQHVEGLTVVILGLIDNLPLEQRIDILNSALVLHRKVCMRFALDTVSEALKKCGGERRMFADWLEDNAQRQEDQIKRQVDRVQTLLELLSGRQTVSTVPPRRPK